MKNDDSLLSRVEISTPCTADWASMTGDERVRACQLCHLNVYNISTMTENEAESFLRQQLPQGKACVRLYRRPDGTILTDNCPRVLRAARNAARLIKHQVAAVASLLLAFLAALPSPSQNNGNENGVAPVDVMLGKVKVSPSARPLMGEPLAGKPFVRTGDTTIPTPLMGGVAPLMGTVCPEPNMAPYKTKMQEKISKLWKLPKGSGKKIKLLFKINSDGSISDLQIGGSSGDATLDQKALTTVKKAAPFGKLPPLSPAVVDADFTFQ